MPFINIYDDQHAAFLSSLKVGQYNLLLGSGVSLDSRNSKGLLPSGREFKDHLCELKGVAKENNLQKVFSLLSPSEIEEHVTKRFVKSEAGPTLTTLSSYIWKRAFTFNIDDAMEAAYRQGAAKQELEIFNFNNDYQDSGPLSKLQIIHLHGFVRRPDSGYVFSRDEYIQQMTTISPWLTVLAQFIKTEPFVIAGSSLDEVDLDYYLAHRKPTSGRDDRGPSILVEPFPSPITRNECEQHGLVLFEGTALDFFNYCNDVAPSRPTPYELIPTEEQRLVPDGDSKRASMAFWADFNLVPGTSQASVSESRFVYGHAPTWSDLEASLDVGRPVSATIVDDIERLLSNEANDRKLLLLMANIGTGKSTVLLRCAYELAKRGRVVLNCTALSRLEAGATASVLDLIDDPVVIIADNIADQVTSFADILDRIEKKDIIVLGAERSYRFPYISQVLSGIDFRRLGDGDLDLRRRDVGNLIDKYLEFGIVGSKQAVRNRDCFIREVVSDPIAVACCRILNEFRPLDRIIAGIWDECDAGEKKRYVLAALAQHCFSGGISYSVLSGAASSDGLRNQLRKDHPLPLTTSNGGSGSFIVPQNSTVAERILRVVSQNDPDLLLEVFIALANEIAPRVNRFAIKRRSPEARLAGRLFDFDAIVEDFLGDLSLDFYAAVQSAWQWNSRYWEQVALLKLTTYHRTPETPDGLEALEMAVRHARHAVSVEYHPFSLSTLGKTLIAQMKVEGYSLTSTYGEAFDNLVEAIRLEANWARWAVQPFFTLFRGSKDFLNEGGEMSGRQIDTLRKLMEEASQKFPRDVEVRETVEELRAEIQ